MPESLTASRWEVIPKGWFSRHRDLFRDGSLVATLRMAMMKEACEFEIAGHPFAISRKSLWKDGFLLTSGGDGVCDVSRRFWSRQFQLTAVDEQWRLGPAGWFSRTYELMAGEEKVGSIKPAGWFTRRYLAEFQEDVPPPIQVLAIFLVLIASRRDEQNSSS